MFRESKPRAEKFEGQPAPLPQEIAKHFVAGDILETSTLVHEDAKGPVYRCFGRHEVVPGIGQATFQVDYRKYRRPDYPDADQLRFEYRKPDDPAKPLEQSHKVAEMQLEILDPHTFNIKHRYVLPELRTRKGIGTRLLTAAESLLQQIADESHQPVTIRLATGQDSVMRWVEQLGYSVKKEQGELLKELREHPERFVQDNAVLSADSLRDNIVKDPYTFRRGTEGRYMEDAVRLTFEKVIPSQKVD